MTRCDGKFKYNKTIYDFSFAPYSKVYTCVRQVARRLCLDVHTFHLIFNGNVVDPQSTYVKLKFNEGSMFNVVLHQSVENNTSNMPEETIFPSDHEEGDIYEPRQEEIDAIVPYGFKIDKIKRMIQYTRGDLNSAIELLADEFEPPPLKRKQKNSKNSDLITPSFLASGWREFLKNMIEEDPFVFEKIIKELGRSDEQVAQEILENPTHFMQMINLKSEALDVNAELKQKKSDPSDEEISEADFESLIKALSNTMTEIENLLPDNPEKETTNKETKNSSEMDLLLGQLSDDEISAVFALAHETGESVEQTVQMYLAVDKDIVQTRALIKNI